MINIMYSIIKYLPLGVVVQIYLKALPGWLLIEVFRVLPATNMCM